MLILSIEVTLKALSDVSRRKILMRLKKGQVSVSDLAIKCDMSVATVSYHLTKLKEAGLVVESKYKNYVYYELNLTVLEDVMLWIKDLKGSDDIEE